jgi:hypothetical protein
LYLPASILVLLTPAARASTSLLAPPLSPPDSINDADDQRSVEATMESLSEMTGRVPSSQRCRCPHLPERAGGGGGQPLGQVPPHRHPLSSSSAGGSARGAGFGGIGSGGGDNDIGFGVSIVCMCGVL